MSTNLFTVSFNTEIWGLLHILVQQPHFHFFNYFTVIRLYSLVPSPIDSAYSRPCFQFVSGWTSSKWSWCPCSDSESIVPGFSGILLTASAQAWSRATGSNEANIPMFGTIGASFSPWQSQFGEISIDCYLKISSIVFQWKLTQLQVYILYHRLLWYL